MTSFHCTYVDTLLKYEMFSIKLCFHTDFIQTKALIVYIRSSRLDALLTQEKQCVSIDTAELVCFTYVCA